MIRTHLNTLYVNSEGAYLSKDGAAVSVRIDGQAALRVPLHNLESIVCFAWDIGMSPALMSAATDAGVTLAFLTPGGSFRARVVGKVSGNVLLRREQYRCADSPQGSAACAREFVAAKIANCRTLLLRAAREGAGLGSQPGLDPPTALLRHFRATNDATDVERIRGLEGAAAATYFGVFGKLLLHGEFGFTRRVKHPATDPVNCVLSFAYALLRHDTVSACESLGLDPAVGFLHRDRSGRMGLALDLMEELRPVLADRLTLTLFNRKQLRSRDFVRTESGAIQLSERARKAVLSAYQERKAEKVRHPFLEEKVTWGVVPHLQARLFARYLRGDLDVYPAFYWR